MATLLTSNISWYNPFMCNGRELDAIHILKDGEIFRSTQWFDYSNQKFKTVEFPWDAKVKRTIDLNSKVAFLASETKSYGGKKWNLYIPIELLDNVEVDEEKAKDFGKTQIQYTTKMWLTLPNFTVKHPDKPYANKINGRVSITKYRFEDNDLGKRIKKLCEIAKGNHINISSYDMERMLEVFNLSVKRK